MITNMMTTGHIEKAWRLPAGSVRRDIHRLKIAATKSGNAWIITYEEAERVYGPRPLDRFYRYDDSPEAVVFMVDEDAIVSEWQHMGTAFSPEPFETLDQFRSKCRTVWVDDVSTDDDLQYDLQHCADMLPPTLKRLLKSIPR